jgi:hypothetical protein
VVGDIQTSSTSFEFHLAKIDPTNGAVIYNKNITPSGMDTSIQQSRGALSVSNGNVVIVWGGLNGDCGSYHGFEETVSEASGVEQRQWNTPTSGSRGGIWASSGSAVDSGGNIFVATGNGSSNINNYDESDSVLKFSPALDPPSFFAPQGWPSLGGSDTDLGSVGPELLPNELLFQIGKSGRGYLLSQSTLPNNSNPGGGENASAQVCNKTSDAAFSGMATNGGTVFVPCSDGIAAVSIDSSSSFHRVWYQTSGGGSAPIIAGGLVWTLKMFGGTSLYGLDPSSGSIVATLTLPATTNHFATPSAGDQRLFVPDGAFVVALVPPTVEVKNDCPHFQCRRHRANVVSRTQYAPSTTDQVINIAGGALITTCKFMDSSLSPLFVSEQGTGPFHIAAPQFNNILSGPADSAQSFGSGASVSYTATTVTDTTKTYPASFVGLKIQSLFNTGTVASVSGNTITLSGTGWSPSTPTSGTDPYQVAPCTDNIGRHHSDRRNQRLGNHSHRRCDRRRHG